MTNYVWTVKDQSGKMVVKEIAAATAADAKFVLEQQGFTDLVLKVDDVGSATRAGFAKRTNFFGQEVKVSAEQRLKIREDPTVTYWDALRKGIKRFNLVFLALVFFIGYSGFRREWGLFCLYAAGLLGLGAYIVYLKVQSIYFHKLVKADEWSRWNDVLSLVEALEFIKRFRKLAPSPAALARHRSKALAGLGRLPEGLAEFEPFQGQPDCPAWLYLLHVGGIYSVAKEYDKAIECNLASIAEKPTPTAYIGLAERYARDKRDAVKARAALAAVEKSTVTESAVSYWHRCQGLIAYLEGDFATAKSELAMAIELVEKAKHRYYRDSFLAVTRGHLCCVLAKTGDLPGAKKCWAQAKPYLMATKMDDLLEECRAVCSDK